MSFFVFSGQSLSFGVTETKLFCADGKAAAAGSDTVASVMGGPRGGPREERRDRRPRCPVSDGAALPPSSSQEQWEGLAPPSHSLSSLCDGFCVVCLTRCSCNNDFVRKKPANEAGVILFLKCFYFLLSKIFLIVIK